MAAYVYSHALRPIDALNFEVGSEDDDGTHRADLHGHPYSIFRRNIGTDKTFTIVCSGIESLADAFALLNLIKGMVERERIKPTLRRYDVREYGRDDRGNIQGYEVIDEHNEDARVVAFAGDRFEEGSLNLAQFNTEIECAKRNVNQ